MYKQKSSKRDYNHIISVSNDIAQNNHFFKNPSIKGNYKLKVNYAQVVNVNWRCSIYFSYFLLDRGSCSSKL